MKGNVKMEADFSGWATKSGLKCSDGRTIMPGAFGHQDKMQVPLVWQHGHSDPTNVLGHVILEERKEGVYAYGFFNETDKAKHAKQLVEHKDINAMSIWANQLVERAKRVMHGAIREVSLVIGGANPGALIENINIRHADGEEEFYEDEALIFTGEELEHESFEPDDDKEKELALSHAAGGTATEDKTVEDVYNSMTDEQKNVVNYLVGQAIEDAGGDLQQDDLDLDDDASFQDIYDSMSNQQKQLLHGLLDRAINPKEDDDTVDDDKENKTEMGGSVKHNVFEDKGKSAEEADAHVLSHDDMKAIVADAAARGSLKAAVEGYALAHGIQDIDVLFPEARTIDNTPELFSRRQEWVSVLLNGVKKSPFSRIKTIGADITVQEARAKGYIKGTLKKEEFFRVTKRTTTPTTIYKKQKLDRDDIIDITDFDVVTWMKAEMRLMLDEELARAILLGDGRAVDDEDKIDEDHIRPIATDHEVYVTQLYAPLDDTMPSLQALLDEIVLNREQLRGTGLPTLFTTERNIARMLLLRDQMGRKLYKSIDEVASDLRFAAIVAVEVMSEYPTLFGVIVNLNDYVVGADRGGDVSMFEDFDIDYNQQKYLIETRCSGALTKWKSALVVNIVPATDVLVAPAAPDFDGTAVTIVDQAGVEYRNADTDVVMTAAGSPYPVADGTTLNVHATPTAGRYFESSADDDWSFNNPAGA